MKLTDSQKAGEGFKEIAVFLDTYVFSCKEKCF